MFQVVSESEYPGNKFSIISLLAYYYITPIDPRIFVKLNSDEFFPPFLRYDFFECVQSFKFIFLSLRSRPVPKLFAGSRIRSLCPCVKIHYTKLKGLTGRTFSQGPFCPTQIESEIKWKRFATERIRPRTRKVTWI